MRDQVQFLVIGAQKSGTTSLFQYLNAHPDVYMPGKKEVAYFSRDHLFKLGRQHYLSEFFGNARPDQVAGEASPQYMCFDKCPARIAAEFPDIRLIAVLRNPIERAFSHYRMAVRRKLEPRTFEECIEKQVSQGHVPDELVDEQTAYVAFGEYGRILGGYLEYFDRNQITIVWSEALSSNTACVMAELYKTLGVDPSFKSGAFSRRFHRSGKKRFTSSLDRLITKLINRSGQYLGIQKAQSIRFWYETEFGVRTTEECIASDEAIDRLQRHYAADLEQLGRQFNLAIPWQEWRTGSECTKPVAQSYHTSPASVDQTA